MLISPCSSRCSIVRTPSLSCWQPQERVCTVNSFPLVDWNNAGAGIGANFLHRVADPRLREPTRGDASLLSRFQGEMKAAGTGTADAERPCLPGCCWVGRWFVFKSCACLLVCLTCRASSVSPGLLPCGRCTGPTGARVGKEWPVAGEPVDFALSSSPLGLTCRRCACHLACRQRLFRDG